MVPISVRIAKDYTVETEGFVDGNLAIAPSGEHLLQPDKYDEYCVYHTPTGLAIGPGMSFSQALQAYKELRHFPWHVPRDDLEYNRALPWHGDALSVIKEIERRVYEAE
jgi:hypothetical protein